MHVSTATKALMAAIATLAATSAIAGSPSKDSVTKTVSYGDLDLSNESGRRALDQRINVAAREVCWEAVAQQLVQHRDWGQCRVRANRDAQRVVVSMLASASASDAYASADSKFISVGSR